MASRIIHLAAAHELAGALAVKDKERFYFGHLLPDMITGGYEERLRRKKLTHFYTLLENGRKTYDFYRFCEDYKDKLSDGLYLGYYAHLIEDDIFRQYLYYRVGLLKRRGEPELLDELYADYHLLNPILCKKYGMTIPKTPDGLEAEAIFTRFDFDMTPWLEDMRADLCEAPEGTLRHFTLPLINEYINECREVICMEVSSLRNGSHHLRPDDYSIENYYKGELRK